MFHLLGTLLAPDSPPYQTGRYEITVPPISAQVLGITKGLPLKATQVLSDPLADSRHRPIGDSAPGGSPLFPAEKRDTGTDRK
jgi:hypothetical protein